MDRPMNYPSFRGCIQQLSVFNDPAVEDDDYDDTSGPTFSYGETVNFAHSHSLGWQVPHFM